MDTTAHNDERPGDGLDERERRRAEQERTDLETLARFVSLTGRLYRAEQIPEDVFHSVCDAAASVSLGIPILLDREGF